MSRKEARNGDRIARGRLTPIRFQLLKATVKKRRLADPARFELTTSAFGGDGLSRAKALICRYFFAAGK